MFLPDSTIHCSRRRCTFGIEFLATAVFCSFFVTKQLAAQPSPVPVYKACYVGDRTGTVYRVDDPTGGYPAPGGFPNSAKSANGCLGKNDQAFTWNQIGPQGPQG